MQEEADVGSRQQGTFMSVASVGSAGGQGYNFTVVRKTFHEYKKNYTSTTNYVPVVSGHKVFFSSSSYTQFYFVLHNITRNIVYLYI